MGCIMMFHVLLLLPPRLVTSAFVHVSVLHVAFNMLAFIPIACTLERQLGSLQFAHMLVLLILGGDAFYLGSSYLLAFARVSSLIDLHCQSRPCVHSAFIRLHACNKRV